MMKRVTMLGVFMYMDIEKFWHLYCCVYTMESARNKANYLREAGFDVEIRQVEVSEVEA